MRRYVSSVFVVGLAVALSVGVATAYAGNGGNSANAKLCQKNGWQTQYTSTGQSFTSQDACVSYAAKGGTLTAKTRAQLDCESAGGAFGTDPSLNVFQGYFWDQIFWVCNGFTAGQGPPPADCPGSLVGGSAGVVGKESETCGITNG